MSVLGFFFLFVTAGLLPLWGRFGCRKSICSLLFVQWVSSFFFLIAISTALLLVGALNRGTFFLGFLFGCLSSFAVLRSWSRHLREFSFRTAGEEGCGNLEKLLLCLVFLVLFHTFLAALTPEVRSDPIRYHLRLAQQYAVRGELVPLRENPWWAIPQYAEASFATAILFANDTLAKLVHWFAGFLTFFAVFLFTRFRFGPAAACWAVFLWASTPKVSYEMTTTYVEMILTLWSFLSVFSGFFALRSDKPGHAGFAIILSGFFMGMAFGTKYTAFAVQGLPWLIFPFVYWIRGPGDLVRRSWNVFLSGGALLLADSPWLLRNFVLTGNPIYPLYNRLFGLTAEVDRGIEFFFLTVWPGNELFDYRFYVEKIHNLLLAGYVFPGLVVALGLLNFCLFGYRRGWKAFRFRAVDGKACNRIHAADFVIVAYGICSFAAYLFLTGNMDGRFYLPTLAVLCCYLGAWILRTTRELPMRGRMRRTVSFLLLLGLCFNYVGQRWGFFQEFGESPLPILSEQARWDYYRKHAVGEPEGGLWNRLIPQRALVYNLGFPYRVRGIQPLNEIALDTSTDPPQFLKTSIDPVLDPFLRTEGDADALRAVLRRVGVEYLLVPSHPDQARTPFWVTAKRVLPEVPEGRGRLLRFSIQESKKLEKSHKDGL